MRAAAGRLFGEAELSFGRDRLKPAPTSLYYAKLGSREDLLPVLQPPLYPASLPVALGAAGAWLEVAQVEHLRVNRHI